MALPATAMVWLISVVACPIGFVAAVTPVYMSVSSYVTAITPVGFIGDDRSTDDSPDYANGSTSTRIVPSVASPHLPQPALAMLNLHHLGSVSLGCVCHFILK